MNLTFKQCAELAEVKESTARFYRDTFLGFFSSVGEGRKRQYHPSVVEVIKFISTNYAQNLTQEQIQILLEQKYGVTVEVTPQQLNNATQELHNAVVMQSQEHNITQAQLLEIMKMTFSEELEKRNEGTNGRLGTLQNEMTTGFNNVVQKMDTVIQRQDEILQEKNQKIEELEEEIKRLKNLKWWQRKKQV